MTGKEKIANALLQCGEEFRALRQKHTGILIELFQEYPEVGEYSVQNELEEVESLLFFYARIKDWLNGNIKLDKDGGSARGSMRGKIRKLLGYTFR